MIARTVLIFLAQVLDECSGLVDILKADGSVGEQHKRRFPPRLLVKRAQSCLARLVILALQEEILAKFDLQIRFVRQEFRGFPEQWSGLRQLALILVRDAQVAERDRIGRINPEHLAVFRLGFVILRGGKRILCPGEMGFLGLTLLGAAGARDG